MLNSSRFTEEYKDEACYKAIDLANNILDVFNQMGVAFNFTNREAVTFFSSLLMTITRGVLEAVYDTNNFSIEDKQAHFNSFCKTLLHGTDFNENLDDEE